MRRGLNGKSRSWIFFLIAALALACDGANKSLDSNKDQILHVGNKAEPQTLDPQLITGVPESHIADALFEGLVAYDQKTTQILPAIAVKWDVSADKLTYTFHLRPEAKWSDGEPILAHDFVFSWQRILNPDFGSEYAYMLYPLRNAKAFNMGKTKSADEIGVKALDERTLQVQLEHATSYFLPLITHHSFAPVPRKIIEKFGDPLSRHNTWTQAGKMVSSGPFMLTQWLFNEKVVVGKNPHYWDAQNVRLSEIHFYPIDSRLTEERKFRAGELHITDEVPTHKINAYQRDNAKDLIIYPYFGTYYFNFNVTRKPFDDRRVRMALALAIDRQSLVTNITKAGEVPWGALVPPDTAGYTSPYQIPYDVKKARELLAEAGYPSGKGFPPVELIYNTDEMHREIAEAIQQMWLKNLGVKVALANQDWKVFLDNRQSLNYDIARRGWIGDYIDPNAFIELYTSFSGNNETGWENPVYDELVSLTSREFDEKKRQSHFARAERLLLEDATILPVFVYANTYLKSPRVKNWQNDIMNRYHFKHVYLE